MNIDEYKIVVIGATSEIAQNYLNERLKFLDKIITKHKKIYLVGRNLSKLKNYKKKLLKKNIIEIFVTNFKRLDEKYFSFLKKIQYDEIILAQGQLTNQKKASSNRKYLLEDLNINLLSFITTINIAIKKIKQNNRGKIIIMGSVAGDLGKKSNYTYSYSKAGITNYVEVLMHKYPLFEIYLIKPGPTKTKMTKNLSQNRYLWNHPSNVAKDIHKGIINKKRIIYSPWWWKYIMAVLKILPKKIFNKLNI